MKKKRVNYGATVMVLRAEQMPRRRYRLNQFDIDLHTIEHESTTYGAGRVRFTLNSAHLIGVAVYTDSNVATSGRLSLTSTHTGG
jgi:hypothetical protein